ncbi:O-antigen ligase family protein [Aerococcus kribbianus]|uniref:O-antigen ligase family protein n=1 Tax=Aerococcus kribbianus TaxID=2999064 RepID=A0A9X3JG90_9LACT|nr:MULTISPECIES: O-antigen ligase family protein [unclassified Aerococcus]MCZ0716991.1 O-antigen ligase family protein [Aerococcus sp. YH-aer221]MCZ0725279.1 O-antigen ligase family protein [Aerococcus sp. YH-aer222]
MVTDELSPLNWQLNRILITILFISNFFPFYITLIVFVVELILLYALGVFRRIDSRQQASPYLWIFIAYSLVISIIFQNIVGAFISLGLAVILVYFHYYQTIIKPYYFEELLNMALIASFILFIFAGLEHLDYIPEWDYTFISDIMGRTHNNRVEATFFNPNYYAMMLEFFIMIGVYKATRTQKLRKKFVYSFISLCNVVALLFTGTRTALVVVIACLFIFFYVYGYKRTAIYSFIAMGAATLTLYYFNLLPRMEDIFYAVTDRFEIWQVAGKALLDNYWFGQGPLTYMHVWQDYGEKYTQHAHNIVLDTLLNYGLIGSSILIVPMIKFGQVINRMRHYPQLRLRLALICAIIGVVLIHGLTDVTIFWVQTGFLFLFIILAAQQMLNEVENHPTIYQKTHRIE